MRRRRAHGQRQQPSQLAPGGRGHARQGRRLRAARAGLAVDSEVISSFVHHPVYSLAITGAHEELLHRPWLGWPASRAAPSRPSTALLATARESLGPQETSPGPLSVCYVSYGKSGHVCSNHILGSVNNARRGPNRERRSSVATTSRRATGRYAPQLGVDVKVVTC